MYEEKCMRIIAAFILTMLIAVCSVGEKAMHKHHEFTQHYENSLFQISEMGMFSVEMVIKEQHLKTGVNALDLIIHDKNDRDVVGADITVTPWMPDMGHGVFDNTVITEKGGGLYTVSNVILIMSGNWELRVNIKEGTMEDKVVFDFPDVKVDRGHEHKMTQKSDDLDMSSTRLSAGGNFRGSYKSDVTPIPINSIHGRTLTVVTPDGNKVEDAVISIDGNMPEHGHGLPTQPEVTQELSDGEYLVEGMKFSMPGWWVMKIYIKTGSKEDSVTFNLMLKE
jgi:hypothetical protein